MSETNSFTIWMEYIYFFIYYVSLTHSHLIHLTFLQRPPSSASFGHGQEVSNQPSERRDHQPYTVPIIVDLSRKAH